MDPRSEVLLRQAERFGGALLLAGLPADDLLGQLPQAQGWSWHAGEHATLLTRFGVRSHFGVQMPEGDFDAAVLFLPKARELSEFLLGTLASRLAGRTLYLVGEKKGGIEGAARQLAAFGQPRKLDSARHCQLWEVRIEQAPSPLALTDQARSYTLHVLDQRLQIISLPGVFSHGRLDRGSALLLEHLDHLGAGPLLDFGCGAGVIGAALKRLYPDNEVVLLDVDAFALESSRRTFAANDLQATFLAGSGIEDAPTGLAAIVSNPPFHQGVRTDYRASENLIEAADTHLRSGGELRLVANSFLRYPPLIEAGLGHCRTLAERDGFRIYSASRR